MLFSFPIALGFVCVCILMHVDQIAPRWCCSFMSHTCRDRCNGFYYLKTNSEWKNLYAWKIAHNHGLQSNTRLYIFLSHSTSSPSFFLSFFNLNFSNHAFFLIIPFLSFLTHSRRTLPILLLSVYLNVTPEKVSASTWHHEKFSSSLTWIN